MNRQFHAKISLRHYTLLAALLSVALYFTWHTELLARQWIGLVLGIVLVLMVVLVEKIINTNFAKDKKPFDIGRLHSSYD